MSPIKSFIVSAFTAASTFGFAALALPAHAGQKDGELNSNGPTLNGPILNGPVLNGPHLQGPILNGPHLQGPVMNGPHLQGPVMNGPHLQGPALNGGQLNAAKGQAQPVAVTLADGRTLVIK